MEARTKTQTRTMEKAESCCKTCKWYYDWFGVCFNGDSEWRGDTPLYPDERACKCWEKKTDG